MIPHLRPGCPYRDLAAIRVAATWCDELNRWRLPDVSSVSLRISLPPPAQSRDLMINGFESGSKPDHNNNSNASGNDEDRSNSADEGGESEPKVSRWKDIADAYFRRNRIDELLAHAREAKTFGKSLCNCVLNLKHLNLSKKYLILPNSTFIFVVTVRKKFSRSINSQNSSFKTGRILCKYIFKSKLQIKAFQVEFFLM